jgi:trigger factor
MKIIKSQRKENIMTLEIEIPHDFLEKEFGNAFKKLVKKAKISGFRPGKIPRSIFEKHYGTASILQEGVFLAMNNCYSQAIIELGLQVVDYPKNINIDEYKENQPVRFTCEVTVKPVIKLGKYKGIKLIKESTHSVEDQVDTQLQQLREQMATYRTVERSVQQDDVIRINITSSSDNQGIESWSRDNMAVKVGAKQLGEEFDTEVMGMNTGDKKAISLTYDVQFQHKEVAGKTVDIDFDIMEIREKQLPELDDAFSSKVSECKQLTELRDKIKGQLDEQNQKETDEKLRSNLMELIAEKTNVDLPEAMVTTEVQYDIQYYEEQLKKSGSTIENYLKMMGKSQSDFESELKEGARKRVIGELILDAISSEEKVSVSAEELKEKVKNLLPNLKTEEEIEAHMKKINLDGFKSMLTKQKTMDFLIENAKISEK